jgi:hypothetical protein
MSRRSEPHSGHSHTPPRRHRLSLPPEPTRGHDGPKIIVRQTIKEANATIQYPTLTRSNYDEWAMLMQVNMEAAGIWYAVEPYPDEEVEYRNDRLALAAILLFVPSEMLPTLRGKRTARAAWEAVKTIRVGVELVRESKAQQLRREFASLGWKEGETAEDFSVRIMGLSNNLCTLDDDITDAVIVRKMLDVVPEHLEQVAVSIETLLDLNTVSIEEVTERLRAVEQRRRKTTPVVDSQGRLLLTQEEWMAKLKIGDKGSSSNSGGSGAGAGNKRGGGGRGRDRNNGGSRQTAGSGEGMGQPKKTDKCKYRGKKGHWAKESRSRIRDEAHLAQAEEEDNEPALLMARRSSDSATAPCIAGKPSPLELVEAKVFAQLDDGDDDRDASVWHLDTGATNRMSGSRFAFQDLDTKICGVVRFGDGSAVPIEGAGTVILEGKTDEQTPITGVYFIPRLTTNIISLGQLDEGDCDIHIKHGVLRIRDEN